MNDTPDNALLGIDRLIAHKELIGPRRVIRPLVQNVHPVEKIAQQVLSREVDQLRLIITPSFGIQRHRAIHEWLGTLKDELQIVGLPDYNFLGIGAQTQDLRCASGRLSALELLRNSTPSLVQLCMQRNPPEIDAQALLGERESAKEILIYTSDASVDQLIQVDRENYLRFIETLQSRTHVADVRRRMVFDQDSVLRIILSDHPDALLDEIIECMERYRKVLRRSHSEQPDHDALLLASACVAARLRIDNVEDESLWPELR